MHQLSRSSELEGIASWRVAVNCPYACVLPAGKAGHWRHEMSARILLWPLPLERCAPFESYTGLPWPAAAAGLGGLVSGVWHSGVVLEAAVRAQEEALVGWLS